MAQESRSKNKSGGREAARCESLRKAATAPKGRHSQPRGSAEHNTSPRYAKKMKKGTTDFTDVEF